MLTIARGGNIEYVSSSYIAHTALSHSEPCCQRDDQQLYSFSFILIILLHRDIQNVSNTSDPRIASKQESRYKQTTTTTMNRVQ